MASRTLFLFCLSALALLRGFASDVEDGVRSLRDDEDREGGDDREDGGGDSAIQSADSQVLKCSSPAASSYSACEWKSGWKDEEVESGGGGDRDRRLRSKARQLSNSDDPGKFLCKGNPDRWESDHGHCSHYAEGTRNFGMCETDTSNGLTAAEVCEECLKCTNDPDEVKQEETTTAAAQGCFCPPSSGDEREPEECACQSGLPACEKTMTETGGDTINLKSDGSCSVRKCGSPGMQWQRGPDTYQVYSTLCTTTTAAPVLTVNCGNHQATSCSECPQGHGEDWCHGDCGWVNGKCVDEDLIVNCGAHNHFGVGCEDCLQGHGRSWCHGDCHWQDDACKKTEAGEEPGFLHWLQNDVCPPEAECGKKGGIAFLLIVAFGCFIYQCLGDKLYNMCVKGKNDDKREQRREGAEGESAAE